MAALEGGFLPQPPFGGSLNMTILEPATSTCKKPPVPAMNLPPSPDRPAGPATDLPARPSSALARGIQITQFKDAKVNPEPVPLEETDLLLEEYLSPRKLRALTGVDNLNDVRYLEMKVNSQDTSLGNFGAHLPHLTQLKLSSSLITNVRDLGSSLNNLHVLWMSRSGVEDLDGLSSMSSLQELYLAYNDISDISPCSLLENLTTLDLEGNNIEDISQVHFLSCINVKNLTLEGNPVCVTPSPDEASPMYNYRQAVKDAIPHLEMLDDEPFTTSVPEVGPRTSASVFQDDWALIDELLQEVTIAGSEDIDIAGVSQVARPATSQRPTTSYRPGTSYVGTGIRPGTRAGTRLSTASRPITGRLGSRAGTPRQNSSAGGRPNSGRLSSAEEMESTDDGSDLTRGGVVCGNPSKALRSRHKQTTSQHKTAAKMLAQVKQRAESPTARATDELADNSELFSELAEWRKSHAERQRIIADSKAPQVLTIDHDAAYSASDDEGSITSEEEGDRAGFSASAAASSGHHGGQGNGHTTKSRLPEPPASGTRTHSATYKTRSRSRGRYDESFDAPEENNIDLNLSESRVTPYGVELMLDKAKPRVLRSSSVQSPLQSPENRGSSGETVLGPVIPPPGRRRRGLQNLQLLPSKFTK